jgi:hypothetical protein
MCFTNTIKCFTNAIMCFTNAIMCFTITTLCFTESVRECKLFCVNSKKSVLIRVYGTYPSYQRSKKNSG